MTPGEHDALITKMIGIFEGSFSADGEAPPRLTLEQAWTSRFVICHWKRSIEPCALADLQPKEIEILSNAICHGDCMDDQVVSALKVWPLHFVMTLLPDVTSLADGVAEDESHETLLERAQVQEWEAKVAAFEARLAIDQRIIVQVSKEAVNIFMDQKFPAVSCDELVDLPGQVASCLSQGDKNSQKTAQLMVLYVDFNVPNESQLVLVSWFLSVL